MTRYRRDRRTPLLATCLAGALLTTACSAAGAGDEPASVRSDDISVPASASVEGNEAVAIGGIRGYRVVNVFPHDPQAYTQGLAFHRGRFYEGTGLEGHSSLRRVALKTGVVKKRHDLEDEYFGEGVTLIGDKIYQITWQEETAFVYDVKTFEQLQTFDYNTDDQSIQEGWGLADDGQILAMSDGTEYIRFRDPTTFEVIREIRVTDEGTPVFYLNELEWIGNEIFANVFGYDDVVRIDPVSGNVTGKFNLGALQKREQRQCETEPEVTNGIAYLQSERRFFVTGKNWCHLYEIELGDPPG